MIRVLLDKLLRVERLVLANRFHIAKDIRQSGTVVGPIPIYK